MSVRRTVLGIKPKRQNGVPLVPPRPGEMSSEEGGGDQALRALTEKGPKCQKSPQSVYKQGRRKCVQVGGGAGAGQDSMACDYL